MPRAARVAAGLAVLVALAGCGREPPQAQPRNVPELSGIDEEIAARIREAHGDVEAAPGDAARWRSLAVVYDANGMTEAAVPCYERAVALDAADVRSWYDLAVVRGDLGDVEAAIETMTRAAALDESYVPARWKLGFWSLDLGRLDEAGAAFDDALRLDPLDTVARIGLARVHMQRGETEEAADLLALVAAAGRGNAAYASQLLARVYRRMGRPELARQAMLRGLGAGFVRPDPWRDEVRASGTGLLRRIERAGSLQAEGRADEAVALLEELRSVFPREPSVLTNLGVGYQIADRYEDAVAVLEEAVEVRPSYYPAQFELAYACAALASRPTAIDPDDLRRRAAAHVGEALALNPAMPRAHALQGDLLAIGGRFAEAAAAFREAARFDPTNPLWPYRAAQAHAEAGQWAETIEALAVVTGRGSAPAEAWHLLGRAQLGLGRLDEAEASLVRAAAKAPNDPEIQATLREVERRRAAP